MVSSAAFRRAGGAVLAALAAVLVVAFPAAPAWAHAKLVSTDPAANATVATAVTTITLTFNEPVKQQFTTVVVTGADGVSYSDGSARSVDKQVLQAVKPLPSGAVKVTWKSVSPDGDPIQGSFAFTNAAAPPTSAAASPSPAAATSAAPVPVPTSAAPAVEQASDEQDSGSAIGWLIAGAVVVIVLAAAGFWLRSRRARAGGSGS